MASSFGDLDQRVQDFLSKRKKLERSIPNEGEIPFSKLSVEHRDLVRGVELKHGGGAAASKFIGQICKVLLKMRRDEGGEGGRSERMGGEKDEQQRQEKKRKHKRVEVEGQWLSATPITDRASSPTGQGQAQGEGCRPPRHPLGDKTLIRALAESSEENSCGALYISCKSYQQVVRSQVKDVRLQRGAMRVWERAREQLEADDRGNLKLDPLVELLTGGAAESERGRAKCLSQTMTWWSSWETRVGIRLVGQWRKGKGR
eukprot:754594-Hanusia_phi.AAC.2